MPSEYEREIDEILRRMDEVTPRRSLGYRVSRWLSLRWAAVSGWVRSLPRALPADQLMAGAIVCAVAAFLLRYVVPGLAWWVGLAAGIMFVSAFALSIGQIWGGNRRQVRWRGRVIDLRDGQPTVADRLILWVRRRLRK